MFEDMSDLEILTRMEKNYGPLSRKIRGDYTADVIDKIGDELVQLLAKAKATYGIENSIPRIRMWIEENRVNFLFFDRQTGKRVILGEWLQNKEGYYEH